MLIKRYFSLFAALASLPSEAVALPYDLGYWNVNITSSSSASGAQWGTVSAEYSGAPGNISSASWVFSWNEFPNGSFTYVPTTFKASRVYPYYGNTTVTLWQNLTLSDGTSLRLQGSGTAFLILGGLNHRDCTGSTVVDATLLSE